MEAEAVIHNIIPREVGPGEFLILEGDFAEVGEAEAFLSDGESSVPLAVVNSSESQIVWRAPAPPWPLSGDVRLFTPEGNEQLTESVLDRGSYQVLAQAALDYAEVTTSHVVVSLGGSDTEAPTPITLFEGSGLISQVQADCPGLRTVLVLTEPELSVPGSDPGRVCRPLHAELNLVWSIPQQALDPQTTVLDLIEAFNQSFGHLGLRASMREVPGALRLIVEDKDCGVRTGVVVVKCTPF